MPSPVAHSLMGYCGFTRTREPGSARWKTLGWFVLFSNLPDLHYIPDLIVGEPQRFRYIFLHSFFFAAVVSMILYAVLSFVRNPRPGFWAVSCFLLYSLHVVMDYFTANRILPGGEALFWPAIRHPFTAPFYFFKDLQKDGLDQIFSLENFVLIVREALVMSVPIAILALWDRRKKTPAGDAAA